MTRLWKKVLVMGTFDTKAGEFKFLIDEIKNRGFAVFTLNCGTTRTAIPFSVDYEIGLVTNNAERDEAMRMMAGEASRTLLDLFKSVGFDGVIGMGGGCGTAIITAAMRALPLGIPKVCVSTLAGSDVSSFVGTSDILMVPSLVDICGLNRLLRAVLSRAAGAICGMVEREPAVLPDAKPAVFASMFGNTSQCVLRCAKLLADQGRETVVFHATGTGGRLMESLILEGMTEAVLDLTTTEIADLVCGGIMSAGEERLSAAGKKGLPQVIAPGCLDMVNFGSRKSVPEKYCAAGRNFYQWNPNATLMRTNVVENIRMGQILAAKANAARGPVAFLLPRRGLSILDAADQPFCDRQADEALFRAIRENVRENIPIIEMDNNINDEAFAEKAVTLLTELIRQKKETASL